jgi:hypothetical protein
MVWSRVSRNRRMNRGGRAEEDFDFFHGALLQLTVLFASSGKGFPSAIRGEVAGKCAAQYLTLRGY